MNDIQKVRLEIEEEYMYTHPNFEDNSRPNNPIMSLMMLNCIWYNNP